MASDNAQNAQAQQNDGDGAPISDVGLPDIKFTTPKRRADYATILGLFFAIGLIFAAIAIGQSDANFFNIPALMIVLLGTIAATSISFSPDELGKAWNVIMRSMVRPVYDAPHLAENLISLAIVARKKGVLAISNYDVQLQRNPFLARAMQMVVDGYLAPDIERTLRQEIDALVERHKRSASITLRASEIAPAMGLIGTLVGLVQMLAELENPEAIGPAMAVALLTTFYGAILGTIIMAPLSVKLKKNSDDEAMIKTMIMVSAISIANQENPRRLEMLLNAELPPSKRINYFDV